MDVGWDFIWLIAGQPLNLEGILRAGTGARGREQLVSQKQDLLPNPHWMRLSGQQTAQQKHIGDEQEKEVVVA